MNLEIVIENSTAEISSCIQTREANEEEKEEISKDLEALLNTREGFECSKMRSYLSYSKILSES